MKIAANIGISFTSILVTTLVLSLYANTLAHLLDVRYDWKLELFMVTGQLLFQSLFILRQPLKSILEYWYNLLVISLMGSLMLVPLVLLNLVYPQPDLINLAWFFSVVLVMFAQHVERVQQLGLPWFLCWTWVLYRLLIVLFIV